MGDRRGHRHRQAGGSARGPDRANVPGKTRFAARTRPRRRARCTPRSKPGVSFAQPSRISRSAGVKAHREVPRVAERGGQLARRPSRPSEAPLPTSRICNPASIDIASRGMGWWLVMAADSEGSTAAAQPPAENYQRRRSSGRPPAALGSSRHPVQQRPEAVVIRQVFDGVQHHRRHRPRDPASSPITRDCAAEFEGGVGSRPESSSPAARSVGCRRPSQRNTPAVRSCAHPDDETINNGRRSRTTLRAAPLSHNLTRTLGEEGEVIGDRWAPAAVDEADQPAATDSAN